MVIFTHLLLHLAETENSSQENCYPLHCMWTNYGFNRDREGQKKGALSPDGGKVTACDQILLFEPVL